MKISLITIGPTTQFQDSLNTLSKRVNHLISFTQKDLPCFSKSKKLPISEIKKREGTQLLDHLKDYGAVFLLAEYGKSYTSEGFANFINQQSISNVQHLAFVIGGAYGFSQEMLNKYPQQISLSPMTFTHQMARLLFVEQLYRGLSILHNLPYHNS